MATRVVSFGGYTFENAVSQFQDNFLDLVPRTIRLPGLSGGFALDGITPSAQEIGRVTLRHWVQATSPAEMVNKLDAIRALASQGVKRLTVEPFPGAAYRYCWASIHNIQMSQNVNQRPSFQQQVTFDWQIADPRWYSDADGAPYWGEFDWGDGSKWGGTNAGTAVSGLTTTLTVTPVGNAPTLPKISIMTYAAQTVTNPTIQRLIAGVVVDSVAYTGVLGAHETLLINCRSQAVRWQSQSAYAAFTALRPERWLELQPGANTLKVLFGNSGDAATVRIGYEDAWW